MLSNNRLYTHLDPWKMWSQLHSELNDLWGTNPLPAEMPLNVWTKADQATLVAEMPGRQPADFHVSAHRDVLSIEVDPSTEELPENATSVRKERRNLRVKRQIRLPFEADPENIDATYDRGVLRVNVSRHAATMPVKITVKAG